MTYSGGEGCHEVPAAPCTPSQERTEERLQTWISLGSKKRLPLFFFFKLHVTVKKS